MRKIRKAIIPVAGAGTRFLPATKAMPKEMLPIIDKPVIQYIVEEAIASGIEDIILVTGPSKRAIEDHFDINKELESWLELNGKLEARDEIRKIAEAANFIYIRQKGPYGNGTPVLNAKDVIGDEPFAVIFGDDLFINSGGKPRLQQLIETYEQHNCAVMTAIEVDDEGTKKYGMIDAKAMGDGVFEVKGIVEKPGPEKAPSRIATLGAYILTPDIFEALAQTDLGKDNELWLVDGIEKIRNNGTKICAKITEGTYYDTGSKLGWLKANIDIALHREDLKDEIQDYIQKIK